VAERQIMHQVKLAIHQVLAEETIRQVNNLVVFKAKQKNICFAFFNDKVIL